MNRIIVKRVILSMLIIINCTVIFCFSSQKSDTSINSSGTVIDKIIEILPQTKNLSEQEKEVLKEKMTTPIRKLAHFSVYTCLGFLVFLFCETFDIRLKNKVFYSWIFGTFYAGTDEFHQKFVSGRSAEITDVLIDSSGVIFGVFVSYLICKFIYKNMKIKARQCK